MLSGEFERLIKRLNPRLRIFCGNDNRKAAGLFHVLNGEYTQIIGVDKNFVPEWIRYDMFGHIIKSGWRRVVKLLIAQRLAKRKRAERLFRFHYVPWRQGMGVPTREDYISAEIAATCARSEQHTGLKAVVKKDDLMDISKEIQKHASH